MIKILKIISKHLKKIKLFMIKGQKNSLKGTTAAAASSPRAKLASSNLQARLFVVCNQHTSMIFKIFLIFKQADGLKAQ